jgi:hypothetical protein
MADNINQYGQSLRGAFAQLLGQSPQTTAPAAPSTAPQAAAPINWASLLGSGGGDYQSMVRQALNNREWEDLSPTSKAATPAAVPVAAPPPPPPPAAAPPPDPRFSEVPFWMYSGGGGDAGTYKRGGVVPPTEAQKHAGNYKKHHISFHGLPISIETPKGATREGKDPSGKAWRCTMPADYGYIKRTEGADGDHVDVFVGPDRDSRMVFIINQNDHRTGHFDEHKAMLAYSSERAAVADYVKAFSDGKGHDRIRSVEPMSLDAFKHWLKRGRTKSPAKSKSIIEHALAVVRSKK